MGAQRYRRGRLAHRNDIGDEPQPPVVLPCGDRRLAHRAMRREGALDLPQLDADAAHLDLMVEPPQELQLAARPAAHQVAGAVESRTGLLGERIGEEPLGGELRAAEVAAADLHAADAELAGRADGQQPQAAVEDVDRGVVDRPADGDR